MSNTVFIESQSSDPVVSAIARRVMRIINDATLDRTKREELVHKAQHELKRHVAELQRRQAVQLTAAALKLPQGYTAQSIAVADGRVQVGALSRQHGFAWFDAGPAPQGCSAKEQAVAWHKPANNGTKVRCDPIAERRKAQQAKKT